MEIPLARTRFDVFSSFVFVAYAAIFTGVIALAARFLDGVALLVVLVVLTLFWVLHAGVNVFAWARMRKISHPLGLHGDGLHARSQFGEVIAPWETVQSAEIERAWNGRRLRMRLVPPGDPTRAGIVSRVPPQVMTTINKHGMRYSLRALDVEVDQLREAFVVQSGGRLRVT